jgi:type 1 glutamine amidotransferase
MTAGIIHFDAPLNVLVSVRGHPFERDAFGDVFEEMEGVAATFVDQPAAAQLMTPEGLAPYDALCLYDMPGIDFFHDDKPGFVPPPENVKRGFVDVLDAGKGVVALHHAIAGWPAWPDYADWIGGRFLYRPDRLRGEARPDSGYRHDVTHTVSVERDIDETLKPIVEGVPAEFRITDELYLAEVFEDDVYPLMRSDYEFRDNNFFSAARAVAGEMHSREGWSREPGSNLVAWAKRARQSPLVYLQFGDGPKAYKNKHYCRLVRNALNWAASPQALAWARSA